MARITKKDIYKKYGIDYKAGYITAPGFTERIRPLLVNGNEKIGKGAYHFSTLPTTKGFEVEIEEKRVVVPGTCPCSCVGCYATKGNYRFQSVIKALAIRTLLAREHLEFVERAIMAQIEADKITLCRIHASGDFFSLEYAEMWSRIAAAFPGTTFWTYTKNKAAENVFNNLENANIVKSFLPNGKVNFGTCEHVMNMYKALKASGKKVHICFCGIEKYAGIATRHCKDCRGCAENDYVLFIEHSTNYNASADPLFPELVKMILAQENN